MTTKSQKKICSNPNCSKNGREQVIGNFYSTTSPFFSDSKLHICKSCCLDVVEKNGFSGFQSLMKLIDKPIYSDIYKNDAGDYIRMMNSMPQYKLNTYEDSSLFDENKTIQQATKIKPQTLNEDELNELIDFFGEGYEEKDYIYLITEYEDYLNRYEVDSKSLENLIKEICLTQLDIRKKRANGDKVDAQQKTLQDLLGSSNLKPVQETGNQAVEAETFGTLIKKWEITKPVPEPLDEWKKGDRVGKYLRVWFTGHLLRMMGIENKEDKEYYDELSQYTIEASPDNLEDEENKNG